MTESYAIYALLFALAVWTGFLTLLGLSDTHIQLMQTIPFLWQAFVPMIIWMVPFALSPTFRQALWQIVNTTPAHWLVAIQVLRIGAIGGIVKGLQGEIISDYIFWIGIPDFLFGLSALAVAWLVWSRQIKPSLLISWNLFGFALIVLPTFIPMTYWMAEPGFEFIFQFPMILAPGLVVSLLISLNLLQAWATFKQKSLSQVSV
ncbi:MAG: hypothetical protein JXQ85_13105 [Cognatishimia sp.]|uniref:hypothetical protein n=1 Tax=Cognatishimia sp. TaxID=2211648 RepID=UPI003B8DFB0B